MLFASVVLEDNTIVVREQVKTRAEKDKPETHELVMTCFDALSGKSESRVVTNVQAGAILALAFGGEDYSADMVKELYNISAPVTLGMDNDCRPIP